MRQNQENPNASHYIANGILLLLIWQMTGALHSDILAFIPLEPGKFAALIYVVVYFVTALMLYKTFDRVWFVRQPRNYWALLALVLLALASVVWSVDQATTLRRAPHLAGVAMVALYIGSVLPLTSFLRALAIGLVSVVLASFVYYVVDPEASTDILYRNQWLVEKEGALAGIAWDKNTLGSTAALAIMAIFAWLSRLKNISRSVGVGCGLAVVLSLFILVKSYSATALIILVCSLLSVCGLLMFKKLRLGPAVAYLMIFIVLLITIIVMLVLESKLELGQLTEVVGRSDTFTGRVPLWEKSWSVTQFSPWLGHGYGSIWSPDGDAATALHYQYINIDMGGPVVHAHNGFLQISTTLGVPAAVLAALLLLFLLMKNTGNFLKNGELRFLFAATVCVVMVLHNITEASFLESRNLLWFIFMAMIVVTSYADKRPRKKRSRSKRSSRSRKSSESGSGGRRASAEADDGEGLYVDDEGKINFVPRR